MGARSDATECAFREPETCDLPDLPLGWFGVTPDLVFEIVQSMGFFFEVLAGRPFLQPAQDGESDAPTSARHLISNRAAKRDKLTHLVEAVVRSCKGLKGLGFLEQLAHETQGIDAPKNHSFPNPTEHICPSELTSPPSLSLSPSSLADWTKRVYTLTP